MAGLPEGLEESPGHGSIHTYLNDIPGLSPKSTGPQNNLDETVTCQSTMVC